MVGLNLGNDKKNGELTVGGYNTNKNIVTFHAFDYNGFWEMAWNDVDYKSASSHLRSQKGILLLHLPFIIFPSSIYIYYINN